MIKSPIILSLFFAAYPILSPSSEGLVLASPVPQPILYINHLTKSIKKWRRKRKAKKNEADKYTDSQKDSSLNNDNVNPPPPPPPPHSASPNSPIGFQKNLRGEIVDPEEQRLQGNLLRAQLQNQHPDHHISITEAQSPVSFTPGRQPTPDEIQSFFTEQTKNKAKYEQAVQEARRNLDQYRAQQNKPFEIQVQANNQFNLHARDQGLLSHTPPRDTFPSTSNTTPPASPSA